MLPELDYYDAVLVAIPAVTVPLFVVTWLLGASTPVAVIAGAGPALALVVHALFVNAPVE